MPPPCTPSLPQDRDYSDCYDINRSEMELPINRTSTYAVSRLMIIIILSFTACLAVLAISCISTLRLADTIKIVQNKRAATELELLGDGIASLMEKCGNWASRLQVRIKQEQKLLEALRKSYIESNQEEDDVVEIRKLTRRIERHNKYFDQKRNQISKLKDRYELNYKTKSGAYGERQAQNKEELIKIGEIVVDKLEKMLAQLLHAVEEIRIDVKHSEKWLQSRQNQKQQKEEEYLDQNLEFLSEYRNMPLLARTVLNPEPSQFLASLYSDQADLHAFLDEREYFYQSRMAIISQNPTMESLSLIRYSMISLREENSWSHDVVREWRRVAEKWGVGIAEKRMCVVVPSFNNARQFRVELNLNSIFSQNYTNYHVVIVDDASTDATVALIHKYLSFYRIPPTKALLLVNSSPKKALENIYSSAMEHCGQEEVVVVVDGDDELIGFNVLQVLNAAYTTSGAGFLYSNFYYYQHLTQFVKQGFTVPYTQQEKTQAAYREVDQKFSHLLSFRRNLLSFVSPADLQDKADHFYEVAYDFALAYPLMELSCGKVERIDQYQYLYNIGTGLNDYELNGKNQESVGKAILGKKRYPCSQQMK